ncbi:Lysylphosphatidylglycerol synthetase/glycosyltransferase AglD [Gemmatirosa kalamazoonensis]|uniref:Lysylphosphatidylglycerol synthetase/glycosyltransferase AglD n=1 Tax=Gemmatirosa kalamazoonensis TaxID=861299 RepID=W0RI96_9BACT|nr:lysylphosphatidylglycerol synthase transmembrane domain-containing protein [Gemmatirosa kalamazoonensis]AHG90506.1 Lysylphosphatidylglycerol synthetase/glycosyltransferase AglD [Gemmatirosa kalamazoonensis]
MKLDWRSALGIVLSAALLWWTLKDESLTGIWGALRGANVWWFLVASAVCMLIFPLRALRWQVILEPVAGRLPYGPLWRATCIGMMVNNVVPYRAGELARAFALTREVPNISFATVLASLAVDRVFDAVVLLLLTFAPLLDPAFPWNASAHALPIGAIARTALVGVVVLLALLYALVFFPNRLIRLFELATRRVAPGIERRGAEALAAFAEGLGVLRHPGRFVAVFMWTLVHWIVQVASIWIGFFALGIRVPFGAALLLNGVSSFASVLPAAPGFFGQFELSSKLSLRVYGVRDTLAVGWALGYHVLTFIPITIVGAVYFARLGFSLRELTASGERDEPRAA